ncbi:hypothetical protein ACFWZR_17435 [Streptomyces sp. NPDC059017]|uniref:hypothetical protein n=1 Tax=unclassified Streptomyces TaxID=2593676 RepID=UPI00342EEFB9
MPGRTGLRLPHLAFDRLGSAPRRASDPTTRSEGAPVPAGHAVMAPGMAEMFLPVI